ncbi:MAG: glucokinase [Sphingomicrobium sp.]
MEPTAANTYRRDVRAWLLVEASKAGVVRIASAAASAQPRLASVRQIDVDNVPTFTDILQRYARDEGVALSGLRCAVVIAGAATGESISLVRSRWTISRAGLTAVFGSPPVILNDVAARAWGISSGTATIESLRGHGRPCFTRPGRYGLIMVDEGVGAAIVDVDRDLGVRVLETESGHMDFAPGGAAEERLAAAVGGPAAVVSWEKMLMLDWQDPVWRAACPEISESARPLMLARMLGRFTVNLMHSFGAWQGVMMTGARGGRIVEGRNLVEFESEFIKRRVFSRLIGTAPVWRVDQHDAVLAGAAERLAHDLRVESGFLAAA